MTTPGEALKAWETATDIAQAFHAGELLYAALKEELPPETDPVHGHSFQLMCASCLNEPIDVENIYGPCPELDENGEHL